MIHDPLKHVEANCCDWQRYRRSIDEVRGDLGGLDAEGNLVDNAGDPGRLVSEQRIAAFYVLLQTERSMHGKSGRKRETLGTKHSTRVNVCQSGMAYGACGTGAGSTNVYGLAVRGSVKRMVAGEGFDEVGAGRSRSNIVK
jgi:hypothetical protein